MTKKQHTTSGDRRKISEADRVLAQAEHKGGAAAAEAAEARRWLEQQGGATEYALLPSAGGDRVS